ncbi:MULTISPECIES: HD domain-containing protein [Bradyrhizobium]|uniref:HD domain-containing protein n=1 Tax=Bradyrhizobium TaxID=374 RepID=UPI0004AF9753|nr:MULTISPECIES: HD domain-containing protein [Bradyrhizobium]MBR0945248.1 bifunctional (p)ppGpp synthetase/guanosine-3',5'-bis(diphosphate) 3'-pyrophosphohydrolase [Bradyrhizobium liaoningense]
MTELIIRAREFAREKHAAQKRDYTGAPYFVHLEEVAGMVERAGLSEFAIAAAWLHDVVEDCSIPLFEVRERFGLAVAIMVRDLTSTPPMPGENRASRQEIDRARLANSGPETQGVKCADLISNTATIVKHDPGFAKRYLPEKRALLAVLTRAPAPLRDQAWASLLEAERELEAANAR